MYLSANKPELNTEIVDLYSEDAKLVVNNPHFNGIPVVNYHVQDNNTLHFTLPADLISAEYDIIICNPAGYTKASARLALNVIQVVGVFAYKSLTGISGNYSIVSMENENLLTLKQQFLYDYASNVTLSLNAEAVISINGDIITTMERFLASN